MTKPLISFSEIVEEDPYFLDVDKRPNWQSQFGNTNPIKLEIGFGMGNFLIEMAAKEPASNFIGIDFYHKGIRKLMTRIKKLQLENIRVVYGDIRSKIPMLFKDRELNTVYINFPDPWPKKRHFKRRLIKPEFIKQLAQKLNLEGITYLATDNESYALEILEYFNAEKLFQNIDSQQGFLKERIDLPKTKYEKNFINAGEKIFYLEYMRLGTVSSVT
ncbi:MAG: tRNA (guanosine(46)-N7)-methyltransferase TrmB [Nitrospinota bacterium]|nr:tRNA (guanosine(46)-N7)-methyltransferase TrmB [Nitrospinota bacterium]